MDFPKKPGEEDIELSTDFMASKPEGIDELVGGALREEKYGTLGQQILTGLEGAASAATFGLSTGLQTGLGLSTPEDIQARREVNPLSYTAGQVGGIVGSSLLLPGAGAAGLASKAGTGAARVLGLTAAEGAGALTRIAHAGVREAVESALFTAGDEVSRMFSSSPDVDPADALETAVANVGLASIIGGGLGAGVGSVGHLWNVKFGKKVAETLNEVSNQANAGALADEARLAQDISQTYSEQSAMIGESARLTKENAQEIQEAFARRGLNPTAGSISGSSMIQNLESETAKRGTIVGQVLQKERDQIFRKARRDLLETAKDATDKSQAVVGREIKEGIAKELEQELAPIESSYNKLKPEFESIGIPEESRQLAVENIMGQELAQFTDSEAAKTAQTAVKNLSEVGNLDKLKSLNSLNNKRIEKAMRTGGEELPVLLSIKKELRNLRDNAIETAAKNSGIDGAESASGSMIQRIKETDDAYRSYKTRLKELGTEAALGNLGSARQLLEKFAKLPDEVMARRIFDTNDVNQLTFFREKFPKQFELAKRFKKKELLESSISQAMGKNSELDIGSYLRKVEALAPEAKQVLFTPSELSTIQDYNTIYRSIPGSFNHSNTSAAGTLANLFSPQGLLDNAADGIKLAVLKGLPSLEKTTGVKGKAAGIAALKFLDADGPIDAAAFKAAAHYIQQVIHGENLISKGVQGVVSSAGIIPQKAIPDDRQIDRLDKRLKAIQSNESEIEDTGGSTARYLPRQGEAIGQTTAQAVNYLNSLRPAEVQRSPLDPKPEINVVEQERFRKALSIAQQPLSVLPKIKDASVNSEDLQHIKTLYPALYKKLSFKLLEQVRDTVTRDEEIPYETIMGLSTFLGLPLDSTMTGSFIRSAQPAGASSNGSQSTPPVRQKSSLMGMEKLAVSARTSGQNRLRERSDN